MAGMVSLINKVLRLLILAGFLSHWMACLFYLVGREGSSSSRRSWIVVEGLVDLPVYDQYITSLYWAVTTMLTVIGGITHMKRRLDTEIYTPIQAGRRSVACSA